MRIIWYLNISVQKLNMRATCLICTDLLDEFSIFVACPCGHIFHENCITQWLGHSSTCPECRSKVTSRSLVKLFFNISPADTQDTNSLENEVSNLKAKLSAKDVDLNKFKSEKVELLAHAKKLEDQANDNHGHVLKLQRDITKLQLQIKSLNKQQSKIEELEKNNSALHDKLQHFQNVQIIISGTQKDVNDILQTISVGPDSTKQIATYCSLLKRELSNLIESKQTLRNEITFLRREVSVLNVTNKKLVDKVKQLEEQTQALEKENVKLIKRRRLEDENAPVSVSKAVVAAESPVSEKTINSINLNDSSIVTPVRDRLVLQPLVKAKVQVIPYEKTITLSKTAVGQSAALRSISNMEYKSNDSDSLIRSGYNGFGGHSNFISRSFKSFKPPHKRK